VVRNLLKESLFVCSVKSFSDELRSAYHTATVDNVRVSCVVTQFSDADDESCIDYINSILVSAAVNYYNRCNIGVHSEQTS